jgi:hypothetical protein
MSPRLRGPAQVPASSTTNPHYSNSLQTPCPNFHVDQSRRKNCASTAARRRTRPLTDRALIEALRRIDARIRHDPAICVAVSGRITGRAAGGMAETIRRRMVRQDEFTDASLEPAEDAVRRADFRQRTRMVRAGQSVDPDLAADLQISPADLHSHLGAQFFGAAWAQIEQNSPMLHRRRVRFADLPRHIKYARELLILLGESRSVILTGK